MRAVPAIQLKKDDVLLLPFGKTATIRNDPKVGRQFVSFLTEFGPTRLEKYQEVMVQR